MVRFPLLVLILLAAFGFPRGAGAQGVFDFEPDTLFYTDSGEVVMTNVSPDIVVLDSMTMRWPEETIHHWYVYGGDFEVIFGHWYPETDTTHVIDSEIEGKESLNLTFWLDTCPFCIAPARDPARVDTLIFHSNGLVANDTLILDWANLIADEEGPKGKPSISLKAMPNPSAGLVEVQLSLATASEVSVSIFDTRGRRVAVLRDGAMPAGDYTLTWNSSEAAPGIYYIRARTSGGAHASRSVVITR